MSSSLVSSGKLHSFSLSLLFLIISVYFPFQLTKCSIAKNNNNNDNNNRALVLDVSYRPIDTLSWNRAVVLDFFDKVDVLEYYDSFVRSARDYHYLPAVIRVKFYVKKLKGAFDKGVPLTRKNVYARDHNECQYCGSRKTLTLDHVIPTSKGGKSSWENLVTCCSTCNQRKANKDLSQLNMKLKKHPKQPSHYEMSSYMIKAQNSGNQAPAEWKDYLPPGAAEWVFDRE